MSINVLLSSELEKIVKMLYNEHFEILDLYMFSPQLNKLHLINVICDILRKDSVPYDDEDIRSALVELFDNERFRRKFFRTLVIIIKDSGNILATDEARLEQAIRTGDIWSFVGIAVKKCLGPKRAYATIPDDFITGPNTTVQKIVNGFNSVAKDYKRKEEPLLRCFLHEKFFNKKSRIQKKNLSRVLKNIKSCFMLVKAKYHDENAPFDASAQAVNKFFVAIRREFFK